MEGEEGGSEEDDEDGYPDGDADYHSLVRGGSGGRGLVLGEGDGVGGLAEVGSGGRRFGEGGSGGSDEGCWAGAWGGDFVYTLRG